MLCPIGKGGAEFAIFIHQDFRNQGIGSEFTRITLQYGRTMRLRHIWLTVRPTTSPRSGSTRKWGFTLAGLATLRLKWCSI
jgi:ribosomal protein S18 acetylase RimI-like enzyme